LLIQQIAREFIITIVGDFLCINNQQKSHGELGQM